MVWRESWAALCNVVEWAKPVRNTIPAPIRKTTAAIVRASTWVVTWLFTFVVIFLSLTAPSAADRTKLPPAGLLACGSSLLFPFPAQRPVDFEQSLSAYSREAALDLARHTEKPHQVPFSYSCAKGTQITDIQLSDFKIALSVHSHEGK